MSSYIYSMPHNELNSDKKMVEKSETQRKLSTARSTPIACIVCDEVFFDNVSLVLHSEVHLKGDISIPMQRGRDPASLQSHSPLSVQRTDEAHPTVFPRMKNCISSCPLPVSAAKKTNLTARDGSLVDVPVLNTMPQINSSFGARLNVSQPIHCSMMSPDRATSSSTRQLMYSRLGARRFAYGFATARHLQLMEQQNGGQARFPYISPLIDQLEKPIPELIILDPEDDGKNAKGIDLNLKL